MKTNASTLAQVLTAAAAVLFLVAGASKAHAITDCARPIILPEVKLKDATLEEAVDYIKRAVQKLDPLEKSHLNVVILSATAQQKARKITLDVREVQLRTVFEHIATETGMRMRIEAHAVVLSSASSDELRTVVYRVPPYFMQAGSAVK